MTTTNNYELTLPSKRIAELRAALVEVTDRLDTIYSGRVTDVKQSLRPTRQIIDSARALADKVTT